MTILPVVLATTGGRTNGGVFDLVSNINGEVVSAPQTNGEVVSAPQTNGEVAVSSTGLLNRARMRAMY
jgi:hypothetical protein